MSDQFLETLKRKILDILESDQDASVKSKAVSQFFDDNRLMTQTPEVQDFLRMWSNTMSLIYQLGVQWDVLPDPIACAIEIIECPDVIYIPDKTLYPRECIALMYTEYTAHTGHLTKDVVQ